MRDINQNSDGLCHSIRFESTSIAVGFLGASNIWIKNTYQRKEILLAQDIISKALLETQTGHLSIVGYDEELSGVFSPFFPLSSGDVKTLSILSDRNQLNESFSLFRRHIQDIQNLIQGRADSLAEFNRLLQAKNENTVEGYQLVVLVMNIGKLDDGFRTELSRFLRVGPKFGLSFLIISPTEISSVGEKGEKLRIDASVLFPNLQILNIDANSNLSFQNTRTRVELPSETVLLKRTENYLNNLASSKIQTVEFQRIQDLNQIWKKSSTDGLTFCIGKYGMENLEITIGDEKSQRHNAVITGAVGTGKSNLISVIIHSLCANYSPRELQLYLLDFKEGVSLKNFTNLDHEDYLPHAKSIGLESDVNFGLSVLETMFQIYQNRMTLLKKFNVKSIRDLRIAHPEIIMPRILIMIDEFQMMFEGDQNVARQTARLLEKSVRLYRAAGIHFLLASQTLAGNQAVDAIHNGLFNQIPIRLALKNSISESMITLGVDNPHAAYLKPREAIVNLDYGEPSQNRKVFIAYANEATLAPLRRKWWEMAKAYAPPPYVFELSKTIDFSDSAGRLKSKLENEKKVIAMFGERVSVLQETITVPMTREKGKNIAIFGLQDPEFRSAEGMIQGILFSLALQFPRGNAEFLLCDFDSKKIPGFLPIEKRFPDFFALLECMGYKVEIIPPQHFEEQLIELNKIKEDETETFFFALNLDKWDCVPLGYGKMTPLCEYLDKGPMHGKHFIGWWLKESTFEKQVTKTTSIDTIDTRVFLRISNNSVTKLTEPLIQWDSKTNRALMFNAIEFEKEQIFMPYRPISSDGLALLKTVFEL